MKTFFESRSAMSVLVLVALILVVFSSCDKEDENPQENSATVFLSSNNSGQVGVAETGDEELKTENFDASSADADGIYFDSSTESVVQVDRTNSRLVSYNGLDDENDGGFNLLNISISLTSSSNFQNGRGLAVSGDMYIVAQDGSDLFPNQFVIYENTGSAFNFAMRYTTSINLWGLQMVGNDMYAIVDNSNQLAIFRNFLSHSNGDMVEPDVIINIEGIVRTHGIEYDEDDDVMVLTDVGDAASDSDGAVLVIQNWSSMASNTTITAANYTRVAGDNTMLGNPVDVEYDAVTNMVYVAERARSGGLLLEFTAAATGNTAPSRMTTFAGASSIYLHR